MEDTLRELLKKGKEVTVEVLILVLMEDTLREAGKSLLIICC